MINFGTSMATGVAGGGLDLGTINGAMNNLLTSTENSLNTLLTTISAKENPSVTDMLSLQQGLNNYTVTIQTSSTITKDFFDALKEIIQKA
ncbi:MAG TPA: EscF/YscF/HrpA family type III secretion system needle major subunit [Steroidobacteraceae bacterium]|jgi:hypothetical protein|nr:EscF/YscF/HrpA family type III secretion system needle major subunit [Steroidobacteraceae bacterium]